MLTVSESWWTVCGIFITLISQLFRQCKTSKIKGYPMKSKLSKQQRLFFREIKTPKTMQLSKYLGLEIRSGDLKKWLKCAGNVPAIWGTEEEQNINNLLETWSSTEKLHTFAINFIKLPERDRIPDKDNLNKVKTGLCTMKFTKTKFQP